jgi:hypothetical protein
MILVLVIGVPAILFGYLLFFAMGLTDFED